MSGTRSANRPQVPKPRPSQVVGVAPAPPPEGGGAVESHCGFTPGGNTPAPRGLTRPRRDAASLPPPPVHRKDQSRGRHAHAPAHALVTMPSLPSLGPVLPARPARPPVPRTTSAAPRQTHRSTTPAPPSPPAPRARSPSPCSTASPCVPLADLLTARRVSPPVEAVPPANSRTRTGRPRPDQQARPREACARRHRSTDAHTPCTPRGTLHTVRGPPAPSPHPHSGVKLIVTLSFP